MFPPGGVLVRCISLSAAFFAALIIFHPTGSSSKRTPIMQRRIPPLHQSSHIPLCYSYFLSSITKLGVSPVEESVFEPRYTLTRQRFACRFYLSVSSGPDPSARYLHKHRLLGTTIMRIRKFPTVFGASPGPTRLCGQVFCPYATEPREGSNYWQLGVDLQNGLDDHK